MALRNIPTLLLAGLLLSVAPAAWAYPPERTGTPAVTPLSQTSLGLAWTAPASNPAILYYQIEREIGLGGGFIVIANTTNTTPSYTDSGLAPNTVYDYRISAVNASGTGTASDPGAGTTLSVPLAPAAPGNLKATITSGSQVQLTWTAPANTGISGYRIERELGMGGGFDVLVANTSSTATTYTDGNLAPGGIYGYRVTAFSTYGLWSNSSAAVYAIMPRMPSEPRGLKAEAGDGRAVLSWVAPFYDGGGLSGYYITGAPSGTVSVSGTAQSAVITGLANGTAYFFGLKAWNLAGSGPAENFPAVTPKAGLAVPAASLAASASPISTSPPAPASVSVSNYKFVAYLYRGSRGKAVEELQKRLIAGGYLNSEVTGYFGALTEAALQAYQSANGVSPAGVTGPLTRALLNK